MVALFCKQWLWFLHIIRPIPMDLFLFMEVKTWKYKEDNNHNEYMFCAGIKHHH